MFHILERFRTVYKALFKNFEGRKLLGRLNSVFFWDIMRCRLVSNRRFGTSYWAYLQGSSFFLDSLSLEDETDV
jgi:hypothetical protein